MNRKVKNITSSKLKKQQRQRQTEFLNGKTKAPKSSNSKYGIRNADQSQKMYSIPFTGSNEYKLKKNVPSWNNPSTQNETIGSKVSRGTICKKESTQLRKNWAFKKQNNGLKKKPKGQLQKNHKNQTQSFEKISRKMINGRRNNLHARSCQSTHDKFSLKRIKGSNQNGNSFLHENGLPIDSQREKMLLRNFNQNHLDYLVSLESPLNVDKLKNTFRFYMRNLEDIHDCLLNLKDPKIIFSMKKALIDPTLLKKRKTPFDHFDQSKRTKSRLRTGAKPPNPVQRRLNYLQKQLEDPILEKMKMRIFRDLNDQVWKHKRLVRELPQKNEIEDENIYDVNRISLEHHTMDPFLIFKSMSMTGSEIKNLVDLDGNQGPMAFNFAKKRLFLVDPRLWDFNLESAKNVIKMQTDSNQSSEVVPSGAPDPLHSVLTKLWWEEYISFDLFNHLSHREK